MWARLTSNQISRRQNLDIPRFLQLVDKPSLCGQRFIYAGGARGGKAHLESDQMSRKALPCKACVEHPKGTCFAARSDYFRAARRHKNNDIISGCRKSQRLFRQPDGAYLYRYAPLTVLRPPIKRGACFYAPLYLRRVARPPRMWRWDLFSSRMAFACV